MFNAKSTIKTVTIISLALYGSTGLSAEQNSQLEQLVITADREDTPWLSLTNSVALLPQQDIEFNESNHVSELLNQQPGVNIHRNNGMENLVSIRSPVLTGSGGSSAFLLLEDSIALRAAGFSNVNGLSEAAYEQAGAVEILRGPGSVLYGSNAIHGVVNVLTQRPSDQDETRLSVSAGPHELVSGQVSVFRGDKDNGLRINALAAHDGGYRENSGYGVQKLQLRHDKRFVNKTMTTSLSFFNLNQETAGYFKSGDQDDYEDKAQSKLNPNPDAFRDWWSLRLYNRWMIDAGNNTRWQITPYLRSSEIRFRRHFVPENSIETSRHSSIGTQIGYFFALADKHQVQLGADLEYTQGSLSDIQEEADKNRFGKYRPQGMHYDYEVDGYTVSPFANVDWELSEKLHLETGIRYDYTHYSYDNLLPDGNTKDDGSACPIASGCLFLRPADRDDDFDNFSGKLGFSYLLSQSQSLYGSLSRGFRAPHVSELYQLQNQQVVGEVESESIDSVELGVRGVEYGITYEAAMYYAKKKNTYFRDADGLNVTNGKSNHRGFEVAVNVPLGDQFELISSYTYSRHHYDFDRPANGIVDGNEVDTAPRHLGNTRLNWYYHNEDRVQLEWIHVSNYFLDPSNDHKYDGHDLFNLRIDHAITDKLSVSGKVTNLMDTDYANRADFAFGSYRFFPGEERAVHVGVTVEF